MIQKKILRKLPSYLVTRWGRTVDQWLIKEDESDGGYPPFSEFCHFLRTEARIACNPVTSLRQTRANDEATKAKQTTTSVRRQLSSTTFATGARTSTHERPRGFRQTKCSICESDHELDICREFLKLSLKERKDLARSKGLCCGCLGYGHKSRYCKRKKTCKVCEGSHPSSLHDSNYKPENKASKSQEETQEKIVSNRVGFNSPNIEETTFHSLIVPVFLSCYNKRDKQILMYALLDEQSDGCFIKDSLLSQIDIDGPKINILLSTVLGRQTIKSKKIEGLIVKGLGESEGIRLPKVYTRESIPANRSQIPRPETAAKWPHLCHISKNLMPYREDLEIGILIGLNCTRAIKPCEIIIGKGDEPYAKRTALGWGIIGTVNRHSHDDETFSTSIVHKHVVNPQRRSVCHFTFQTKTKEIFSPQDVLRMFNLDFNDRQTGERSLSIEDIARRNTKKEYTYLVLSHLQAAPISL